LRGRGTKSGFSDFRKVNRMPHLTRDVAGEELFRKYTITGELKEIFQ
jgi:hypothetical protein